MKDVKQLIDICSDIRDLNNFYLIYTNKLKELDEAIVRFCKVHMNAQNRGDILQILDQWKLTQQEKKSPIMKIGRLLCSVPRPLDFTVGLDVPLKVLKTQLLKEKKQQLLLTAPGGCRKAALVTMLGHDKEIIGKFKDKIFFVPVSKILNLTVIVQRLCHHLCGQEPEFQSDEDAIYQLQELLTNIGSSPILLILDDVWSGSEFRLEKFKIVRSCGRFPPALEVSEKPVEVWRCRARKWSNGHSILKSSPNLLQCLQKSLEFLDDEDILKECFMDLASFPEGHGLLLLP